MIYREWCGAVIDKTPISIFFEVIPGRLFRIFGYVGEAIQVFRCPSPRGQGVAGIIWCSILFQAFFGLAGGVGNLSLWTDSEGLCIRVWANIMQALYGVRLDCSRCFVWTRRMGCMPYRGGKGLPLSVVSGARGCGYNATFGLIRGFLCERGE